jgi:tetratricopeptide (TPR) repeat protein
MFVFFAAAARPLVPAQLGFGREYYVLGNMQLEQGAYESAVESYKSALGHRPDSAFVENNLGAAYLKAAQKDKSNASLLLAEGAAHLKRAAELAPGYFEAWKNLGLARAALGDTEGAQEALYRALQLAPGYSQRERVHRILQAISR